MEGWVKLYRELLKKPIWLKSSPEQKTILVTLLLMACHEQNQWEWNGGKYECKPGQFITSLDSITEKCGKGISTQNVRTALKRFENLQFLTNESTKHGRLISIENWEVYQMPTEETNKDNNSCLTKSQQRPNKDLTPNKNEKNDKNVKNKTYTCAFETLWSAYPRKKEKAKAYGCFKARLSDGFSEDELETAVKRYADECKGREDRFIKLCATFLGPNTPFMDYLGKGEENDTGRKTETDTGGLVWQAIRAGVSTEFEGFD